jgi:hypothetical protein
MSIGPSRPRPNNEHPDHQDRINTKHVILSDYATLMIEVLKDNARPEAAAVYGAVEMDWAKLVGQIAKSYGH